MRTCFLTRSVLLATAVAASSLFSCSKPSTEATADAATGALAPSTTTSAASASVSASASASATPPASAASTGDFDEPPPSEKKADRKATREITKANYKSELTKIEKEIGNP